MAVEYECCGTSFFIHIAVIVLLVLFAGLMSGLTLGLMSMSLVDLEVLAKSGTPRDRIHADFTSCEKSASFALYFTDM
jgi:metal transporter CNNM